MKIKHNTLPKELTLKVDEEVKKRARLAKKAKAMGKLDAPKAQYKGI